MLPKKLSYHKAADRFIKAYYEKNAENNIFSSYRLISRLANNAKQIAKSLSLKGMDYQNAIISTWFRYSGVVDIGVQCTAVMTGLLNDFFDEVNYPASERQVVENAIISVVDNKDAETKLQQVVADAVNSQLADENFMENVILLKEELNRLNSSDKTELYYSNYFLSLFLKTKYYTGFAIEKYSVIRNHNFQLLEKRIWKLEEKEKAGEKSNNNKATNNVLLTNKETEDLFKIAFRNYNQLVAVADSKASLLININSIIISVMLAFVLSRVEKNMFLLWPTILLLAVCMGTILLSILASRPQKNSFLENRESRSYQRFFFGSFDLIDLSFRNVAWEEYYNQINELFSNSRENVYLEIYKESYNVRKVLLKKFNYLSKAYWVFIIGLLISILAFIIAIQN